MNVIKPHVEQLLRAYQAKKGAQRYLDYDDLLLVVATQLQSNSEAQSILAQNLDYLLLELLYLTGHQVKGHLGYLIEL